MNLQEGIFTVGQTVFKVLLATIVFFAIHQWRIRDLRKHLSKTGGEEMSVLESLLFRIHTTLAIIAVALIVR